MKSVIRYCCNYIHTFPECLAFLNFENDFYYETCSYYVISLLRKETERNYFISFLFAFSVLNWGNLVSKIFSCLKFNLDGSLVFGVSFPATSCSLRSSFCFKCLNTQLRYVLISVTQSLSRNSLFFIQVYINAISCRQIDSIVLSLLDDTQFLSAIGRACIQGTVLIFCMFLPVGYPGLNVFIVKLSSYSTVGSKLIAIENLIIAHTQTAA